MRYDNEFASFVPQMGEVKKLNVLCVSKRQESGHESNFHAKAPSDTAEVTTLTYTSPLSALVRTMVSFNGGVHELRHIRSGLGGGCVVFGIKLENPQDPYDIWELYTDIPSPGPHCPQGVTSESLREDAARCIRS